MTLTASRFGRGRVETGHGEVRRRDRELMQHLRLLVGLVVATAAAWFTIDRLARTVGPAAALAAGAIVVALFSAVFHRFWRERSASAPPWTPPAGPDNRRHP